MCNMVPFLYISTYLVCSDLGALGTFAIGHVGINWALYGDTALMVVSVVEGLLITTAGLIRNMWVSYINYILFRVFYQMMLAVASAEVANKIRPDSHGLVFGINTFLGLALQTVLTAIVVDRSALALKPMTQFVVYGAIFIFLGGAFLVVAVVVCFRRISGTYVDPRGCEPALNIVGKEQHEVT